MSFSGGEALMNAADSARAAQKEADAALIQAAESQVHVLLTEGEEFSAGQLAYNICQWLAEP